MLNSGPLVSATLRVDPNAQRLALIGRLESWLVLPRDQAIALCVSSVPTEADARKLNDMLVLLRVSLADERLKVASSLGVALSQKFPGLATPPQPPPDEAALRAQLDALYQRQLDAQKYTVPPLVTAERLETMAALVADYHTLLQSVAAGRQVYIDINFFAAHATYALARGWQQLGMSDRAARCYADASPLFKRGERPLDADQAMQLARSLGHAAQSDFDGASAEALRTLIDGRSDGWTRARAYARLSDLSSQANASFDALHYADQAVAELAALGYDDPETDDFDAAFQHWIDACSRIDTTTADGGALEHLNEVAQLYLRISSVRFADRTAQNLATAAAAQATGERLATTMGDMNRDVELAHAHVMTELARYRP